MSKFIIRSAVDTDKNLIMASWLKGMRHSNEWLEEIPAQLYQQQFNTYLNKLLARPNVKINIACLPDDEDVILGYCVYEDETIHWIFVKHSWRKMGIGRALFPQGIKKCTHQSPAGKALAKRLEIQFNPFMEG